MFWGGFWRQIFLIGMGLLLLPMIFYILTVRRALDRCARESRTIGPDLPWLLLIPLFNLFWHFYIVLGLSRSLGNEFQRRQIQAETNPGLALGLAVCILFLLGAFAGRFLGFVFLIAALVSWVLYWLKVGDLTAKLATPPPPPTVI